MYRLECCSSGPGFSHTPCPHATRIVLIKNSAFSRTWRISPPLRVNLPPPRRAARSLAERIVAARLGAQPRRSEQPLRPDSVYDGHRHCCPRWLQGRLTNARRGRCSCRRETRGRCWRSATPTAVVGAKERLAWPGKSFGTIISSQLFQVRHLRSERLTKRLHTFG